jgi:hypothetical protein
MTYKNKKIILYFTLSFFLPGRVSVFERAERVKKEDSAAIGNAKRQSPEAETPAGRQLPINQ